MEFFFREKGQGIPVVLIHGFCETHQIWNGFDDQLAKEFRVFSIDLPGFGKSALPQTPFSIDDIARLVINWLNAQKIENPILIGHSLGGYVILAMAEQDISFNHNLVLFHSSIFSDPEEKKANRNKVIDFVKSHGVAPFIETFVPSLFYKKEKSILDQVKSICLNTKEETLIAYTMAMRDRPDRSNLVVEKINKLLIISGLNDEIIPCAVSQKMASINQGIQLVELSETGHMGMIESPELALRAIKKFIKHKNQ
jgi:pimeloyl-ACP methyl ester carboxylesterase